MNVIFRLAFFAGDVGVRSNLSAYLLEAQKTSGSGLHERTSQKLDLDVVLALLLSLRKIHKNYGFKEVHDQVQD
jgi:hypothetical protein